MEITKTNFLYILCITVICSGVLCCNHNDPDQIPAPGRLGPLRSIEFQMGGETVEVEVAITTNEQMQGLMHRDSMPENHGMLFVYSEPRFLSFWMKDTKIPLSIAFIKEDGTISNIETMKPHTAPFNPSERYLSKYKAKYALEMNLGWFEKHGIQEGDTLSLPYKKIDALKKQP